MKITTLVGALLATATLGISLPATTVTAHASMTRLKTIPKNLRGTWYHYYGKKIGLHKIVLSKNSYKESLKNRPLKARKHLTLTRLQYKHLKPSYEFTNRKSYLDYIFYFNYTATLKGKKHAVLVAVANAPKPWIYTRYNPGKHQYMAPLSVLKQYS